MSNEPVFLSTFEYEPVEIDRPWQIKEMACLNYMTSRLRAALLAWVEDSVDDFEVYQWWLDGLRTEMDVTMAIVGYAAASGRFIEVHPFLRGLAQGLDRDEGPKIWISRTLHDELYRVRDVRDPTEIVDEYYEPWWTWHKKYKTEPPIMVNRWDALNFHIKKYGLIRPPIPARPEHLPDKTPEETLTSTDCMECDSKVCKERLRTVIQENRKSLAMARTLQQTLEEKRVAATRHSHSLRLLRKYQLEKGRSSLDEVDCDNMLLEAGDDACFEVPSDSELQTKQKAPSAKLRSAGISITTGPSTNRSRDLTPKSLSPFDDDSSSEYKPSQ
ncbi:hypothetical protein B0H34DRAFT_809289 [Crassisporium funariophilum]|nr:hypothetical protein B0H34DRAFT_809289 [Crassisporium funariophilum]